MRLRRIDTSDKGDKGRKRDRKRKFEITKRRSKRKTTRTGLKREKNNSLSSRSEDVSENGQEEDEQRY